MGKKVLYLSNSSMQYTGFGKNTKTVLMYLHQKGYEIVEYATAPYLHEDPHFSKLPWKAYGAVPNDDPQLSKYTEPGMKEAISYGGMFIDKIVKEEKPDVILLVEDIWAFPNFWERSWWKNVPTLVWTTLDSLPMLPLSIETAKNSKEMWVWSDFATREMHRLGHTNVKTVRGAIPTENFKRLEDSEKAELRRRFNIKDDTFIIGMSSRNQLRKLFPTLMEAFQKFKGKNPNSKLLFHTNWSEGWDLPRMIKELDLRHSDVLTTYLCTKCNQADILPFMGVGIDCRFCSSEKSCHNPNVVMGFTEQQLNQVYNLFDCYVHPMTSGGQELTVLEAIMAEIPVAIPNYACGVDYVECGAYSLDYVFYRELSALFQKSQPLPYNYGVTKADNTILDFLDYMELIGKKGRDEFAKKVKDKAVHVFAKEKVLQEVENWIEAQPPANYDFVMEETKLMNPDYPLQDISDTREWIVDMYQNILNMSELQAGNGITDWMASVQNGISRQEVYEFFVNTARQKNAERDRLDFKDELDKISQGKKRLAFVLPGGPVDCVACLSVLDELAELYNPQDWDMFIFSDRQLHLFFEHLPYVKKVFPYHEVMDKAVWWEGKDDNLGIVDIAFIPRVPLKHGGYIHNGIDINELQA